VTDGQTDGHCATLSATPYREGRIKGTHHVPYQFSVVAEKEVY